ncbi:SRPBCC domain-containing protein [Sporosarcina sp. ACRSL]|uniref:SRPBCC domain-containing protein n=1 Tax=Sporosarcina sp. ACRSL TaxID=2918215 RepID=UPI001EF55FA8|nr:SRPBCC domain-containing protein [Sporosarcina sp. ACRSL]MCG7343658.1 SRPBCC domain-containing protein [Sporosarcina sp. ACRSL]
MEKVIDSVKREIFVNVSPEKVWKALTVPEERNRWETRNCELDIRVGGKVSLDYGWGVSYVGTIIELEENQKLVLKGKDEGLTTWTITPQDGGSVVAIEYTGMWLGDFEMMQADNMAFGTYQFMRNLKNVYEGKEDLRSRFWRSWIGVLHRTNPGDISGAKVVKIQPNTPADGLIAVGDIVTNVNGTKTASYDELEIIVSETEPNQKITLNVIRDGQQLEVELRTVPYGQTTQ